MAKIMEYKPSSIDRALIDKNRHRQLIESAIVNNIENIIDEESIVNIYSDKKVKISIKGLKEYYFKYEIGQKSVGMGIGNEQLGNKITKTKSECQGLETFNKEGDDIYEIEIYVEDVIDILFYNLKLPEINQNKTNNFVKSHTYKKRRIINSGSMSKVSRKHTIIERLKREKSYIRNNINKKTYRNPFYKTDLRYFTNNSKTIRDSRAVIVCMMDVSGSMGQTKKYLARSFYFLIYNFINQNYISTEIIFITHTTTAKEVDETSFFYKGESGGTYISSAYKKAIEIIEKRYPKDIWNIYCFHCSDGDNWAEDNKEAIKQAKHLCKISNLFGYIEIKTSTYTSSILNRYIEEMSEKNFAMSKISTKSDIWPCFKSIIQNTIKEGV